MESVKGNLCVTMMERVVASVEKTKFSVILPRFVKITKLLKEHVPPHLHVFIINKVDANVVVLSLLKIYATVANSVLITLQKLAIVFRTVTVMKMTVSAVIIKFTVL